jgi:hypothetical protein
MKIQTPYINSRTIMEGVRNGGPRNPMPQPDEQGNERGREEARILELAAAGWSRRRIEQEVFGFSGGAAYETVKKVLENTTTTDENSDTTSKNSREGE